MVAERQIMIPTPKIGEIIVLRFPETGESYVATVAELNPKNSQFIAQIIRHIDGEHHLEDGEYAIALPEWILFSPEAIFGIHYPRFLRALIPGASPHED